MAVAKYHSDHDEKSALLLLKPNAFQFDHTPVCVPREAVGNAEVGSMVEIPEGYTIVPLVDIETGEVRTAKNGAELKTLQWL
ncbi:MAG: hypothetical protein WD512_16130 [Candidatus Paceibacterota bacterium]